MALIDDRGRLFGRFNLIDVAVALFVAILLPMGYVAYRVFRRPPPMIASVTPSTLRFDAPPRVRLNGSQFRPYLNAYTAKAGDPFALNNRTPGSLQAVFRLETPTVAEITFPPLAPGAYDVYLYDASQEVARMTSAFAITAPPPVTVDALVRFVVPHETVEIIKEGDRDRWEENGVAMLTPSEVAVMGAVHATGGPATLTASVPPASTTAPGEILQATVRIPAIHLALGGWAYKSQRLRAGESFIFETLAYRINGVILRATEVGGAPPQGGR